MITAEEVKALYLTGDDSKLSQGEFYFRALLSMNENLLQIAITLDREDRTREALMAISARAIPARFEAFILENRDLMEDDKTAQSFSRNKK